MLSERPRATAWMFLAGSLALCAVARQEFREMSRPDLILPGPGVKRVGRLSEYAPEIAGGRADSPIYHLEGGSPGGTLLVLGGTHPNEPAGFIAAVVLVERARAGAGRVVVIPQACWSGFSCTDPLEGYPQSFGITTRSGERRFRFGSRAGNPVDQWPDPTVYVQYPSGQQLSGADSRNLNRAYPGRANGSFTERAAHAIMRLIEEERVDVAIDLHEAAPEIPIIDAIVAHEKGREIAASAVLSLELGGSQYALELSPKGFRGLSHREWGDRTDAYAFLMETSNPVQGRLRGKTSAELVVKGRDPRYGEAAALGSIRITYGPDGEPLARRVGRHLEGLGALLAAHAETHPGARVVLEDVPSLADLAERGVGAYLN